jgi:hypothetical protein
MNGLVFASYRFLIKLPSELGYGGAPGRPTLTHIALAGAGSGILCSCVPPFLSCPHKRGLVLALNTQIATIALWGRLVV